ncbi:MAG TPA: EamA family transporter [Acidimicrobiales bacterium]|nr:EamA family transporter [Acidimicrobiales bacterium]
MSRRGWALFIAMGAIWGIPYLLIKVAVEDLSPSTLVLARTGLAGLLLLPLAASRGLLRPVLPFWRPLLAYSVIEICLPWVLLGYAEQHLSSSLTGLLVAAVPLVGAVLVKLTGHEVMGSRRVVGLLVGFAGVAALVGFDVGASSPGPVAAVGFVAIFYALGPLILARHLAHLPGLGVVTASLLVTAVIYIPFGLGQWPDHAPGGDTVLAVIALAVVCTAVAFLAFFELIAEVGPSRATVITYVNPAVALVLGVLVLDEHVTLATGAGFALILLGSVLATRRDVAPEVTGEPAAGPTPAPGRPESGSAPTAVTTEDVAACPVPEP